MCVYLKLLAFSRILFLSIKLVLKVKLVRYRSFVVSLTICSKDLTIVHEDDNSVTRFS